jgi:hypothetical protein
MFGQQARERRAQRRQRLQGRLQWYESLRSAHASGELTDAELHDRTVTLLLTAAMVDWMNELMELRKEDGCDA